MLFFGGIFNIKFKIIEIRKYIIFFGGSTTGYLQGMPAYAHLDSKFDIQGQSRFAYMHIYICVF